MRFFLLITMLALGLQVSEAKKKPLGNGVFWEVTKDGVLIISGQGAIPSYDYNDRKRKSNAPWFSSFKKNIIHKTVVEEGISEIGSSAFACNTSLEVILPNSLLKIDNYAFEHASLKTIELPNHKMELGSSPFQYSGLTNIRIPDTWEEIPQALFEFCEKLSEVEIPHSVRRICKQAFMCSGIKEIKLPTNLEIIEDKAFYGTDLVRIVIPEGVEEIGDEAFSCSFLKSASPLQEVVFPTTLKRIGKEAFRKTSLRVAILPDSVNNIGPGAFYECKVLHAISFPKSANCGLYVVGDWKPYGEIKPYNGIIYSLPSEFDNISAYEAEKNYGISKDAYWKYKRGENGIINSQGKIILLGKSGRKIKKEMNYSDNSVCYVVSEDHKTGILHDDGHWILPMEYDAIEIKSEEGQIYYDVLKNGKKGRMKGNERWVIPVNKDFNEFNSFVAENGIRYYVARKGSSIYSSSYSLYNDEGNFITQTEFEELEYLGGNYMKYKMNGYWGVMTLQGEGIIPTSRGYTSIGKYNKLEKNISFEKNDSKFWRDGLCDENGKQLSLNKISKPSQSATNTTEKKKSSTSSKKNSSSSSSSSKGASSSSSSSDDNKRITYDYYKNASGKKIKGKYEFTIQFKSDAVYFKLTNKKKGNTIYNFKLKELNYSITTDNLIIGFKGGNSSHVFIFKKGYYDPVEHLETNLTTNKETITSYLQDSEDVAAVLGATLLVGTTPAEIFFDWLFENLSFYQGGCKIHLIENQ